MSEIMKHFRNLKRYHFLFAVAASTLLLSLLGYAGKNSVYADYSVDILKVPQLAVVFEGIKDGNYPWNIVDGNPKEAPEDGKQLTADSGKTGDDTKNPIGNEEDTSNPADNSKVDRPGPGKTPGEGNNKPSAGKNSQGNEPDKDTSEVASGTAIDSGKKGTNEPMDSNKDSGKNNNTGNGTDTQTTGNDGSTGNDVSGSTGKDSTEKGSNTGKGSVPDKDSTTDNNTNNPDNNSGSTDKGSKGEKPVKGSDTDKNNDTGKNTGIDGSTGKGSNSGSGTKTDVKYETVKKSYFKDALFIGDSRTVGLSEYSGWTEPTYFADVGLTIYDIFEKEIAEINGKKLTVDKALAKQKYGKIYIMLGINELGTGTTKTFVAEYKKVIEEIRKLQPDAIIYIEGIMNVTKKKSDSDPIFNNKNIKDRNNGIATLADNKTTFYIDVNEAITDKTGGIPEKYTFDNIHLKAAYYKIWTEFLLNHGVVK